MAMFGSDWLDDYDSMKEYETSIGGFKDDENHENDYDKPCIPGIHIEKYDSLEEFESNIKHFND